MAYQAMLHNELHELKPVNELGEAQTNQWDLMYQESESTSIFPVHAYPWDIFLKIT